MKALIIDDHTLFRQGLASTLKEAFPVTEFAEASSVGEAVRSPGLARGEFDFIITDLLYPGSEPFAPLVALLSEAGDVPVVVVSALDSTFYAEQALHHGARAYIYKSSNKDDMAEAISTVLKGGVYFRPGEDRDETSALAGEPDRGRSVEWCGVAIPNRDCIKALTPRQHDVLKHLMKGQSNKEIARKLGLFEGTVKMHLKSILQRLGAQNRTQAVVIAVKLLNGDGKRDSA